jgi:probable F420-dependent oxidoreductase
VQRAGSSRAEAQETRHRENHRRGLDPLTALAAAAAVTTKLRLGTGILLVGQRDPITTAKALATIDHLSNGRLRFGVGFGSHVDEMTDHGVVYATRRKLVRETVLAMQEIWTKDVAHFDGEFVQLSPMESWPKPVHVPVPVLIGGGAGDGLFRHIAEYGSGWIPRGVSGLKDALPRLRDHLLAAGRDPARLDVVSFSSADVDQGKWDYAESLGVTDYILDIPPGPSDAVRRVLDEQAAAISLR